MKYSEEQLKNIAIDVIHAIDNKQNIYHEEVKMRLQWLAMRFRMIYEEVIEKVREMV